MKKIVKLKGSIKVAALILLLVIVLLSGGLFWLYKVESSMAKKGATPLTNVLSGVSTTSGTTSGSEITSFYDRIKSLYDSYETDTKKKKSGSGGSTSGSSGRSTTSDSSSDSTATGIGGVGESGVLDSDVPWREEGEPDLDYSYREVRACGAAVKGPPNETIGTAEFDQAYHDYLSWIDADCRAAYNEAGKEYPF